MANQPPFAVTKTITELTAGLSDGETYRAQHVGGRQVWYCNYATQPDDTTDIGWNFLDQGENIQFEADPTNPVWVRTYHGQARLTISELSS